MILLRPGSKRKATQWCEWCAAKALRPFLPWRRRDIVLGSIASQLYECGLDALPLAG